MNHIQPGVVNVPLSGHEKAIARTLYETIEIFLHSAYECADNTELLLVDDLIHDVKLLFSTKGWIVPDEATQCLSYHARNWVEICPDVFQIAEGEKGIIISYDRHFNFSLISGYIQILQRMLDLPPISFQFVQAATPSKPDVAVGYLAEISSDAIYLIDTNTLLQKRNNAAQTFFDHIRFGREDPAIKCIESGYIDLDAFDGRALKWAARYNHVTIFKKLLDGGARYDIPGLEHLVETSGEMKAALQSRIMKDEIKAQNRLAAEARAKIRKNRNQI